MKAVDTNILARLILGDDPRQQALAREAVNGPMFVSSSVLVELGWVLEKKLARNGVADALDGVLALEGVHVSSRSDLLWALGRYRAGADWADMVHIVASGSHAESFLTFDKRLAPQAGDEGPLAVETLA